MGIENGVPVLSAIYGEVGVDYTIACTRGAGGRANRGDLQGDGCWSRPWSAKSVTARHLVVRRVHNAARAAVADPLAQSLTCVDVGRFRTRSTRWL